VLHDLRIEIIRVESRIGSRQIGQVEDQPQLGEAGYVGAGNPEQVGGGARR